MCRFLFYLGPAIPLSSLLTEPAHSLIRQSFEAKERAEPLNGDGFGVAWYAAGDDAPAQFRAVTPAWSNRNLRHLARVVKSGCVMAHVRAATLAGVSELNCHPFVARRYAFMHNGDVEGFSGLRRKLIGELSDRAFEVIEGSTDSEHLFALFLDELGEQATGDTTQAMADALARAIGRIVRLSRDHSRDCYLNLAVTDGRGAACARFSTDPEYCDSLYFDSGRRYVCEDGVCRMIEQAPEGGAVIVSSEPLSTEGGWSPVPVNHMVVVRPERTTTLIPIQV
jgi:predicted glutamine amidotransferase